MRLRILVLTDDSENIALVRQDDEDLHNTRVGSGPSPRAAVQDAVNAYFSAQAEPLLAEPQTPVPESELPLRVSGNATTVAGIRTLLEQAARERARVCFQYEDANGTRSLRTVSPSQIEDRRRGMGFHSAYLLGFDHDRDDMRTFLVDRIEWAQVIA